MAKQHALGSTDNAVDRKKKPTNHGAPELTNATTAGSDVKKGNRNGMVLTAPTKRAPNTGPALRNSTPILRKATARARLAFFWLMVIQRVGNGTEAVNLASPHCILSCNISRHSLELSTQLRRRFFPSLFASPISSIIALLTLMTFGAWYLGR